MKNNSLPAKILLKDGTEYSGWSFGYEGSIAGEVVFNTAMTGYPESLTDPSYSGQILVLTYPLVGNYGVPEAVVENGFLKYFESDKIHISGLVISDYSFSFSHWNASQSLSEWLKTNKIPAVYGIDTRKMTKQLREKGSMPGCISIDNVLPEVFDPSTVNLVEKVSIPQKIEYGEGKYRILLIDCGVKNNIIRSLLKFDTSVVRVPWNYDFSNEKYDGLFISNGPGDPKHCIKTIRQISNSLKNDKPVFGICLGNQLMGLAAGANTYKLKYGHRSHNQPVLQNATRKAFITSQNHGYAIENDSIPDQWEPFFINLNDQTNEGIRHTSKPFFSAQFHPEAAGGPSDTMFLFDQFIELVKEYK